MRHLATHTSGFVYEFWNGDIPKYMEATGHPTVLSGLKVSLNYPLAFDPGERWDYGIGIDWRGQIVEAVDGRPIDLFCREEIFEPLGMVDTNFEVTNSMAERLAGVKIRGEDGQFADFELAPPSNPEVTADTEFFPGFEKSHSFGFMRMQEDVPGMRSAGSQAWAGVLNSHYWFDPASDVVGLIMRQTLPFVEPRFINLYETFEQAVYAR